MKVWLATGKTGDVALAWYAAPGTFPLYGPSPTTAWQVWSARSTNATASAPAFDVSQVSATPVGFGYMWSWSKAAISTASYFGDSLHLAIAPDGAVVVSYADVGNPSASEIAYVVAAHQVSGVGLTAPGRSLSGTPGLGLPVTLNSCPQLRFRSAPAVSVSRGVATVSIELRSARDFASIPVACGAALRPYVAWIAEWTTVGHREYAGAGVAWPDAASRPDVKYFGGMGPTYVGYHLPEALSPNIAAYPGRFALTGTLDPNTGRLSIDVPLQQFGLQAGQTLTDLQFFALIGTRQEPVPQAMARLIGQTPAVTLPLR
jgi:hypothetical protein